jgi:hypothetical protein
MLSDRDREWWLLWMLRGWPSSLLVYALVSRWTIHPCTLRLSKNHVVCQHGSCWATHQWSICSSFTRHQSPIASFKPQAVWTGPIMVAPPCLYWVPNRVTGSVVKAVLPWQKDKTITFEMSLFYYAVHLPEMDLRMDSPSIFFNGEALITS